MTVPHLEANQHVDAHQYDKEWFNAAREGRWDILDALLKAGYPIESTNSSGYTALILAAYDNHPDTLDKLTAAGANACFSRVQNCVPNIHSLAYRLIDRD